MLAWCPAYLVIAAAIAKLQRDAFREQRAWLSRINAYLNENITGMSVIQLFNRQQRNFDRFDERNTGLLHANLSVSSSSTPSSSPIVVCSTR